MTQATLMSNQSALQQEVEMRIMMRTNESNNDQCRIVQRQFAFLSEVSDKNIRTQLLERYRTIFANVIRELFEISPKHNSILEHSDLSERVSTLVNIANNVLSGKSQYCRFLETEEDVEDIMTSSGYPKGIVMLTFTVVIPHDENKPNSIETSDELLVFKPEVDQYVPYGTRH